MVLTTKRWIYSWKCNSKINKFRQLYPWPLPCSGDLIFNLHLELSLQWLYFCLLGRRTTLWRAAELVVWFWRRLPQQWFIVLTVASSARPQASASPCYIFVSSLKMAFGPKINNNACKHAPSCSGTYAKAATWKRDLLTLYVDGAFIKRTMGVVPLRLRKWKYYIHPFKIQPLVSVRQKAHLSSVAKCLTSLCPLEQRRLVVSVFFYLVPNHTHTNNTCKCNFSTWRCHRRMGNAKLWWCSGPRGTTRSNWLSGWGMGWPIWPLLMVMKGSGWAHNIVLYSTLLAFLKKSIRNKIKTWTTHWHPCWS